MLTNYHGHTKHCKHGTGTSEEHIIAAINAGLTEIGISEHVPIKNRDLLRISYEEFDQFATELNNLKYKYGKKIKIYFGLECEYVEEYMPQFLELKARYNIDYLILGQHFSETTQDQNYYFQTNNLKMVRQYIDSIIVGLDTKEFAFLAHPDIIFNIQEPTVKWLEECRRLFAYCEENKIIIELNCNGLRKKRGYPHSKFWEMAGEYDLQVVINDDAHHPDEIADEYRLQAEKIAFTHNLNIIEKIVFD